MNKITKKIILTYFLVFCFICLNILFIFQNEKGIAETKRLENAFIPQKIINLNSQPNLNNNLSPKIVKQCLVKINITNRYKNYRIKNSTGSKELDNKLLEAVKRVSFEQYIKNGINYSYEITIPFIFLIGDYRGNNSILGNLLNLNINDQGKCQKVFIYSTSGKNYFDNLALEIAKNTKFNSPKTSTDEELIFIFNAPCNLILEDIIKIQERIDHYYFPIFYHRRHSHYYPHHNYEYSTFSINDPATINRISSQIAQFINNN